MQKASGLQQDNNNNNSLFFKGIKKANMNYLSSEYTLQSTIYLAGFLSSLNVEYKCKNKYTC